MNRSSTSAPVPAISPFAIRRSGHRGRLVGVDTSPGMIAKANSANGNVEFLQADAQSLPFPDASFDVVTARHMLYHVADIPLALREAHRVLRPAGRFLAVTNIRDNFGEYRKALNEAAETLKGQIADVLRIVVPASDVFNEQNGPSMIASRFRQRLEPHSSKAPCDSKPPNPPSAISIPAAQ